MQAAASLCRMQELGYQASCFFTIKDYWRKEKGDFGMFSHHDPDLPESEPYPSFYHFYFLKKVLGDQMIETTIDNDTIEIISFASSFHKGGVGMVIINPSLAAQKIELKFNGFEPGKRL
jgi:hypothetical protein